mgnify:CR=1 FL=1
MEKIEVFEKLKNSYLEPDLDKITYITLEYILKVIDNYKLSAARAQKFGNLTLSYVENLILEKISKTNDFVRVFIDRENLDQAVEKIDITLVFKFVPLIKNIIQKGWEAKQLQEYNGVFFKKNFGNNVIKISGNYMSGTIETFKNDKVIERKKLSNPDLYLVLKEIDDMINKYEIKYGDTLEKIFLNEEKENLKEEKEKTK